jgi:hypothetical protein
MKFCLREGIVVCPNELHAQLRRMHNFRNILDAILSIISFLKQSNIHSMHCARERYQHNALFTALRLLRTSRPIATRGLVGSEWKSHEQRDVLWALVPREPTRIAQSKSPHLHQQVSLEFSSSSSGPHCTLNSNSTMRIRSLVQLLAQLCFKIKSVCKAIVSQRNMSPHR